jgi:hypothetical protein
LLFSPASSFSLREKVAEGRMRGLQRHINQLCPLTLALSLMERGLFTPHPGWTLRTNENRTLALIVLLVYILAIKEIYIRSQNNESYFNQ